MSHRLVKAAKEAASVETLQNAVQKAAEWFNSLTPEQQREHRQAQRKSWVKGETMLECPDMTEAEFERLWDRIEREG